LLARHRFWFASKISAPPVASSNQAHQADHPPGCHPLLPPRPFLLGCSERGVVLPLEVFRTHGKGWGVRCACDIPGGAFICSYEGELITHTEAVSTGGGGVGSVPPPAPMLLCSAQLGSSAAAATNPDVAPV
jgi:hypothetical protein